MPSSSDDPNPAQLTSLTLLQRVRGRDQEAWGQMHRLYRPFVLYWCVRWGVRNEDADDVTQDVFVAASAGLEGFRRDRPGDSFRGWLRGITHNMVLQHFRKAARHVAAAGGSDMMQNLAQVAAPSENDDPPEQIGQLHARALELVRGEFEERSWQMFWQTAIEGRPPADVGADLGVSSAAVRKAKSRVLHRLKEEVGDLLD
jgi:RNA polymerase sigma-70 factor (ECF subfamily)